MQQTREEEKVWADRCSLSLSLSLFLPPPLSLFSLVSFRNGTGSQNEGRIFCAIFFFDGETRKEPTNRERASELELPDVLEGEEGLP